MNNKEVFPKIPANPADVCRHETIRRLSGGVCPICNPPDLQSTMPDDDDDLGDPVELVITPII